MKKDYLNYLTSSFSWVLTLAQTNELFQTIMLILSAISTLVTLAYTLYKWYNKAMADGKITKDEIQELKKDLKEATQEEEENKNVKI